ncbi:D-alanyl-D-alanine carboxypeptidase/D-alanyl-D-alanine-endopeptidase [Massilia sp. IC2-477]|uniref:D-alanyl-D-alanine carboxypeptidase/D-alanyl-D-alanine endopeptidase n=1 Tax=Massilia sp. IC2-477 TaxID=2887198 RepID=UPI001D130505|nr:D-alanyl-D-alanine carboxypeptidase/D-alanyl-D-alanine-endopeptidase [Massilia sp. IC2-477]MCC2956116.1 D-alanyl-D-alanine carboxypeptidase/D-alanyl-D-alanine-endopeptidase [Massilia sp. IC2-477]
MPMLVPSLLRAAGAFCVLFALAAQAADPVPAAVMQELARQEIPAGALSYRIEPLGAAAAPAHGLDERRSVNPASAMKLVTTLAALDTLGPAYRWRTALLSDAPPAHGALKGNLYLLGGGEPNLTWERLGAMLRSVRDEGIVSITGDLVLDRSLFEPSRTDIGAAPFDDTPDAWYNVIPDALMVSDGLISYTLSSDASTLRVQATPPLSGVRVLNRMTLDDRPCADWSDTWRQPLVQARADNGLQIVLTGSFPRHCSKTVDLATLERDEYLERLVRALWQEMGGQWRGKVRAGRVPPGAQMLVERRFETLAETVRTVNKNSDAVKARLLLLTMGATSSAGEARPTLERARGRVLDWIVAQGVDPAGIVIENGAGLSRHERISPAALSALLKRAAASRWQPEFAASLPIAALDGTMKNRLKATLAAGNSRLKTGTLRDVAALAGYVRDLHGQEWAVAAFINDPQAEKGRAVLDRLMAWVAEGGAAAQQQAHDR